MASFRLHVFRVSEGLGNAILLELPDDQCAVVDWGTRDGTALSELLARIGGRRVALVAATHAHADHTMGLPDLFEALVRAQVDVGAFVYPVWTLYKEKAFLSRACVTARRLGIPRHHLGLAHPEGRPLQPALLLEKPDWEVWALGPSGRVAAGGEGRGLERGGIPGNETSMVILCRFTGAEPRHGEGKIVLPGDATPQTLADARECEQRAAGFSLHNQAIVVPHHGSDHNLPAWLMGYVHGASLVSCPTAKRHHPGEKALRMLAVHHAQPDRGALYCTAYAGACAATHGRGGPAALVAPGECFGHISLEVAAATPARFVSSAARGDDRRPYGFCGNP